MHVSCFIITYIWSPLIWPPTSRKYLVVLKSGRINGVGSNFMAGLFQVMSWQLYHNYTSKQLFLYKHPECTYNLIETVLHSTINITEFYEQEQSAINTVLYKTKVPNAPILHVTVINKLTFNRILKKNLWLSIDLFCASTMT